MSSVGKQFLFSFDTEVQRYSRKNEMLPHLPYVMHNWPSDEGPLNQEKSFSSQRKSQHYFQERNVYFSTDAQIKTYVVTRLKPPHLCKWWELWKAHSTFRLRHEHIVVSFLAVSALQRVIRD
jgi:hypothetical protein